MSVSLEVVLFSYLYRPIFEVLVNGTEIGGSSPYPTTGAGSIIGLSFKPGPLKISWRFTDTGETVHANNLPMLENVEHKYKYMGVHVLPDDTVEITVNEHYPEEIARGVQMHDSRKKRHGQ